MDQDTGTARVWLRPSSPSSERRTKFFVHLAGPTLGAHQHIVSRLRRVGHTEVSCVEESDYLLVFCPIVSRVVSDIRAALHDISGEKPVILVVMHHTFNPEQVVGESSQQVTNRSVILTVDCLVYEGTFLACNRNDIAWREIQTCLRVSTSQVSIWIFFTPIMTVLYWLKNISLLVWTRIFFTPTMTAFYWLWSWSLIQHIWRKVLGRLPVHRRANI